MQYIDHVDSPLGTILLASDGEALTGLWFSNQACFARTLEPEYEQQDLPVFAKTRIWLDVYFSCNNPPITVILRPTGTPFQRRVWECSEPFPMVKL